MSEDSDGLAAIAEALNSFTSVYDENSGHSLVGGLYAIADAILRLGNADAGTPMGGLEAHGKAIMDSAEMIAGALREIGESIPIGNIP